MSDVISRDRCICSVSADVDMVMDVSKNEAVFTSGSG